MWIVQCRCVSVCLLDQNCGLDEGKYLWDLWTCWRRVNSGVPYAQWTPVQECSQLRSFLGRTWNKLPWSLRWTWQQPLSLILFTEWRHYLPIFLFEGCLMKHESVKLDKQILIDGQESKCYSVEPVLRCLPGCMPMRTTQIKIGFHCVPAGEFAEKHTQNEQIISNRC